MNSSTFAAVDTLPKKNQREYLDPRATRYGIPPIWPVPTKSTDFYVWEIKADEVFPFRPFEGETIQDMNGKVLSQIERLPADQITDMYTLSQFFIELAPFTKLNNEDEAIRVINALQNPKVCDKYPVELGTKCATCRIKDSLTEQPERIQIAFANEPRLLEVAVESANLLREGLSKAIDEARRRVDVAIRDIDDPKSGKSMFFDQDYLNVYHTHNDRPQYRTSTQNSNIGQQIADAISNLSGKKEAPAVDIQAIVAAAVAEATKNLRAELEAEKADTVPAEEQTVSNDVADLEVAKLVEKMKKDK